MREGLQTEEITDLWHETDKVHDIAIGHREILFEDDEGQELLLRIRMAREAMGVAKKRKSMDVTLGGMKKPHGPVRRHCRCLLCGVFEPDRRHLFYLNRS